MLSIIVEEAGQTRRVELDHVPVHIGRSSEAEVVVANESASRHHARIEVSRDGFVLIDLDSSNGTFRNGDRIKKGLINRGDEITVGDAKITFLGGEIPPPEDEEAIEVPGYTILDDQGGRRAHERLPRPAGGPRPQGRDQGAAQALAGIARGADPVRAAVATPGQDPPPRPRVGDRRRQERRRPVLRDRVPRGGTRSRPGCGSCGPPTWPRRSTSSGRSSTSSLTCTPRIRSSGTCTRGASSSAMGERSGSRRWAFPCRRPGAIPRSWCGSSATCRRRRSRTPTPPGRPGISTRSACSPRTW